MGDIADMVIEGILNGETGEYLGDLPSDLSEQINKPEKVNCPQCNKRVKRTGLIMHINAVHNTEL